MKEYYDVIIVGTGAAGLYCALNLPERKNILMITKKEADQSDSFLAQGGICMLRGEDDYEDYFEDTMRAGHYENNKKAVDLMLRSSNSIIRDLLTREVDLREMKKEIWNLPEKELTLSRGSFFMRTLQARRSLQSFWLRHRPEKILKLLNT